MNSITGDRVNTVPNTDGGGGGGADLSNYPDLADATQTVVDTIPVFETSGSKRLKLTTYNANVIDGRVTTNTTNIATATGDRITLANNIVNNSNSISTNTTNISTGAAARVSMVATTTAHANSDVFHANVGKTGQGNNAVALGVGAGATSQGERSVAVGAGAGGQSQGARCFASGYEAGYNSQSVQAVAIGHSAGKDNQGQDAIAIGYSAASQNQGAYAIAVGGVAANTSQGERAIAIGYSAAAANQAASSIAINATGSAVTANQQGLFVAPVRDLNTDVSGKVMCYDTTSKEVVLRNQCSGNYIEQNATTVTTIDSGTYINVSGMVMTPPAGTYNVSFSCWLENDEKKDDDGIEVAICIGNTAIEHSKRRQWTGEAGKYETSIHTQAVVSVSGTQQIKTRAYRLGGDRIKIGQRSMVAVCLGSSV